MNRDILNCIPSFMNIGGFLTAKMFVISKFTSFWWNDEKEIFFYNLLHVLCISEYVMHIFQTSGTMRFAIVMLFVLLGVGAVCSAPSSRGSSTTHLMKRLLAQLLTRGDDSEDLSLPEESDGSGNYMPHQDKGSGYQVRIYYSNFQLW